MYHCHRATQFVLSFPGILFPSACYVSVQFNPQEACSADVNRVKGLTVCVSLYLRPITHTDADFNWMNCCSLQGQCFVRLAGDNTLLYEMELLTS